MPNEDKYSNMTLDQMVDLEQWLYDCECECEYNYYYDQRMELLDAIVERKENAEAQ